MQLQNSALLSYSVGKKEVKGIAFYQGGSIKAYCDSSFLQDEIKRHLPISSIDEITNITKPRKLDLYRTDVFFFDSILYIFAPLVQTTDEIEELGFTDDSGENNYYTYFTITFHSCGVARTAKICNRLKTRTEKTNFTRKVDKMCSILCSDEDNYEVRKSVISLFKNKSKMLEANQLLESLLNEKPALD